MHNRRRRRRKLRFCCFHCIRLRRKRHRRRIRRLRRFRRHAPSRIGASAEVQNGASIDGPVSGLINIILQVPVNTGDATSLNESDDNSLSNVL